MLEVGSRAPEWSRQSSKGQLALGDLLAHGPVVLYFFPKAFTAG